MTCMAGMAWSSSCFWSSERVCCANEGALLDLFVLVGVHEIPVDVLNLGDGRDDLRSEREIGDLSVASWRCG